MNAWLRANTESFAHMAVGCRMGLDEDAVVDPQLRVHGLDGLRVADISVLPAVPSGHPGSGQAMAERACDLILGRLLERLSSSAKLSTSSNADSQNRADMDPTVLADQLWGREVSHRDLLVDGT